MLTLSSTSIASTITSVRSLRYVIYPVQVLFKSCKPVPVMLFGTILGKKYPLRKYVNVIIITCGVALFMGGGTSASKADADVGGGGLGTTMIGGLLLTFSLCFDGATGAYEDKLMSVNNVEPFDLMFNIQLGKSFISFVALVVTNNLGTLVDVLSEGGAQLLVLGLTGALGQVFVFVTISKFGALNSALIGLIRKILSLVLSFILYGHTMNVFQALGLVLSITAMIANFYDKGGNKNKAITSHHEPLSDADIMQNALHGADNESRGLMDENDEQDDTDGKSALYSSAGKYSDGQIELGNISRSSTGADDESGMSFDSSDALADFDAFGNQNSNMDDSKAAQSDDFDIHVSVDRVTPIKGGTNVDEEGNLSWEEDSVDINVSVDRVTPIKSKSPISPHKW